MTGPSSEQLQLQQNEMDFYKQGMQQAKTRFGDQESLLKQMESVYSPILAKGPNQEGFSAPEKAELEAEVQSGTATNYGRAARAVGAGLATQGGGDNPLEGGAEAQVKGEVANAAAGEQSREESQILSADYAQGFKEFEDAGSMLANVSGQFDPVGFENAATNSASQAEKTANDINQEQNSWEAPVFGAIGAVAGAAAGPHP